MCRNLHTYVQISLQGRGNMEMRLPMRKRVAACLLHFVYVPFQTVAGRVTGRKASLKERNLVPSWSNRKQLLATTYYRTF